MTHDDKTQQPARPVDARPVDQGRRNTLKKLGKAAYVAPAVSIVTMDVLLNTAAGSASPQGCARSDGRAHGC